MLRGSDVNTTAPPFLDARFQYHVDVLECSQLYGNGPVEFQASTPVNYLGINNGIPLPPQKKYANIGEAKHGKNLQFSLNNQKTSGENDRKGSFLNQNCVSTGLRLSYDDDERNSSISSASGSYKAASSSGFSSLKDCVRKEICQQDDELNQLLRTQEENMVKGLRDIKQKQMVSFLNTLEKGLAKRIQEKDIELETTNQKNKELIENVKQVTTDAQNWCYMAKYNESIVNILKTNLEQAMQGCDRGKEGFGESYTGDAASCVAGGSHQSSSTKNNMICRSCKTKQVSVLLMPCRHLCLCKECEGFVSVCPLCKMVKTASFEVYLS